MGHGPWAMGHGPWAMGGHLGPLLAGGGAAPEPGGLRRPAPPGALAGHLAAGHIAAILSPPRYRGNSMTTLGAAYAQIRAGGGRCRPAGSRLAQATPGRRPGGDVQDPKRFLPAGVLGGAPPALS